MRIIIAFLLATPLTIMLLQTGQFLWVLPVLALQVFAGIDTKLGK